MNIVFKCDFCGQPLPDEIDVGSPARPLVHEECLEVLADIGREVLNKSPEALRYVNKPTDGQPTLPLALLPEARRRQTSAILFFIPQQKNHVTFTSPPIMPPPRRTGWQRWGSFWRRWFAWYQEGN